MEGFLCPVHEAGFFSSGGLLQWQESAQLTYWLILAQCLGRCFKTPNQRNPHPIACGFFTPIGFASMGGMGRIQHPRGELGRLLVEVLNARPPASKRVSTLNQE